MFLETLPLLVMLMQSSVDFGTYRCMELADWVDEAHGFMEAAGLNVEHPTIMVITIICEHLNSPKKGIYFYVQNNFFLGAGYDCCHLKQIPSRWRFYPNKSKRNVTPKKP